MSSTPPRLWPGLLPIGSGLVFVAVADSLLFSRVKRSFQIKKEEFVVKRTWFLRENNCQRSGRKQSNARELCYQIQRVKLIDGLVLAGATAPHSLRSLPTIH